MTLPSPSRDRRGHVQLAARACRYADLKLILHAGEASDLHVHVWFPLMFGFELFYTDNGCATYVADFAYRDWRKHIEDTKGLRTPVCKLKRTLMETAAYASVQV